MNAAQRPRAAISARKRLSARASRSASVKQHLALFSDARAKAFGRVLERDEVHGKLRSNSFSQATSRRGLGCLVFRAWRAKRRLGYLSAERETEWDVRHVFYDAAGGPWLHVRARRPLDEPRLPSIVRQVYAADWHEREVEDMFGLVFEGHPRLGDFILHDDAWQEGVEPMRHRFSALTPVTERRPKTDWKPLRVVQEPGAFIMPVGPVFAGLHESAHFHLETVGEDVIRAFQARLGVPGFPGLAREAALGLPKRRAGRGYRSISAAPSARCSVAAPTPSSAAMARTERPWARNSRA